MLKSVNAVREVRTTFAWLEITPSCTLKCKHCYVASMPGLGHGKMKFEDWKQILVQLHELGCTSVQFIGGEPTIHPHFCELVEYAAQLGFFIEVYSNLAGITERMWSLFTTYSVHLACSFYTDDPVIHDEITTVPGSYQKTLCNIQKALSLGLTLRVGMVDMQDNQRIAEGEALLRTIGVKNIGSDRIRGVGRGGAISPENPVAALCGGCAGSKCAITASGEVYPCVFARSFSVGNVLKQSIGDILSGPVLMDTRVMLTREFAARGRTLKFLPVIPNKQPCDPDCTPNICSPEYCAPAYCEPDCEPSLTCTPQVNCDPSACTPDECSPDIEARQEGKCEPDECNPDVDCDPLCGPQCHPLHPCQPAPSCAPEIADCHPTCDPSMKSTPALLKRRALPMITVGCEPDECDPDFCAPGQCDPDICGPQCDPDACTPQLCGPTYCDPDTCVPANCEPGE